MINHDKSKTRFVQIEVIKGLGCSITKNGALHFQSLPSLKPQKAFK